MKGHTHHHVHPTLSIANTSTDVFQQKLDNGETVQMKTTKVKR